MIYNTSIIDNVATFIIITIVWFILNACEKRIFVKECIPKDGISKGHNERLRYLLSIVKYLGVIGLFMGAKSFLIGFLIYLLINICYLIINKFLQLNHKIPQGFLITIIFVGLILLIH